MIAIECSGHGKDRQRELALAISEVLDAHSACPGLAAIACGQALASFISRCHENGGAMAGTLAAMTMLEIIAKIFSKAACGQDYVLPDDAVTEVHINAPMAPGVN